VTQRYLSSIGLRILINKLEGQNPLRSGFVPMGKTAVVMSQHTPKAAKLSGLCVNG
jgi:hypothetical protein